jgi:hypothetical protein
MISELLALFLLEGYAATCRHKEMWSPPPHLVLIQLAPVQLEYESPRMTTGTRPFSRQDEWRDPKWEFPAALVLLLGRQMSTSSASVLSPRTALRPINTKHPSWPFFNFIICGTFENVYQRVHRHRSSVPSNSKPNLEATSLTFSCQLKTETPGWIVGCRTSGVHVRI